MRSSRRLVVSALCTVPLVLMFALSSAAQRGNSIEGFVYGHERRPLADLYVELNDDLNRTVARQRTSNAGAYAFEGLGQGTYVVRILTSGTDYEEREERVDLINITPTAAETRQVLFYLKLKRSAAQPSAEAVFVQDVPSEAQTLFDKGVGDLAANRQSEGLAALRLSIEAFPKYYSAIERLGLEYLQLGKPETLGAAELLLALGVAVNPRGFKAWYGLAAARKGLGRYAEALKASEKAVELKPTSADAAFLHGRLLRNAKRYNEAEKYLRKAVELFPKPPAELHWELALIYGNNLGKYSEAAHQLKLYLKVRPDAPNAVDINKLINSFESKAAAKMGSS